MFSSDILPSSMEYKSGRTTMDHSNIIHRADLRASLMGQLVVFQQRTLLRVFLYNPRLLRRYAMEKYLTFCSNQYFKVLFLFSNNCVVIKKFN